MSTDGILQRSVQVVSPQEVFQDVVGMAAKMKDREDRRHAGTFCGAAADDAVGPGQSGKHGAAQGQRLGECAACPIPRLRFRLSSVHCGCHFSNASEDR